jgi:outer membrane protein assembly factor BamB
MKKTIYSIVTLALFAVLFSSCGKDENPITPGDGDTGKNPELWHYDCNIKGLEDIYPAIDEQGNIFLAGASGDLENGVVHFVSVDKDGNERWDKIINASAASYVVYGDGKVFVTTVNPVTIQVYDANSGSELWNKNYTDDYGFEWQPVMAYANHKLYLGSGQFIYGVLMALNPSDGTELWLRNLYDRIGTSLVVDGTKLFIGGMGNITRYEDNGNSCDSIWHWEESEPSRDYIGFEITIAENGNIYTRGDYGVNIISSETGEAIKVVSLGESFDNSSSSITIDGDGNFYIGNGDLHKYSPDGSLEWKSDINVGIISPNYITAPLISEEGKLYNGELFSLSCVKSNGNLDWVLGTEAGIGNLHPVVMDHDGNLISYSTERGVLYCFKGDGSKLATKGWPKRYGNMGNTCSR